MDVNVKTINPLGTNDLFPSFENRLRGAGVMLRCSRPDTVQINLGRLCSQSCAHCHVEAGPGRKEVISAATMGLALALVDALGAGVVDLTGGAPELNPSFRECIAALRRTDRRVIVRSNLAVLSGPGMQDLPEFYAENQIEIVASLPCYTQENVDRQRGAGVFQKSIAAIRRLNSLGYGREGSGLLLHLVYNPLGAELPGPQSALEEDYHRELESRFGLVFNHLYTLTNMPIGRFARQLSRDGEAARYAALLSAAFNPATLDHLMCLSQVSLSWDGYLYDCDFNQMLDLRLGNGKPFHLGQLPASEIARRLENRRILTGPHCYGCTAGSGSSCGGSLV
jgi:radical SAM/Cys-rich protein